MKTKILILLLVLFLGVVGVALTQSGGLDLPRWVLSGGASDSAGGDVTLRATLGQPLVGVISSGDVTLSQGFWHGSEYDIYLPLVQK
jgi:hypothetical protein